MSNQKSQNLSKVWVCLTGTAHNEHEFSIQVLGRQMIPAIDRIVQGVGNKAISFPATDTINTSSC